MFPFSRQKQEPGIPYNITLEYTPMQIYGVSGLYTERKIILSSIPKGFSAFSLIGTPNFRKIRPAPYRKEKGLFICKTEDSQPLYKRHWRLSPKAFMFSEEKPFGWYDFRMFFGQSIPLDQLISHTETKQQQS